MFVYLFIYFLIVRTIQCNTYLILLIPLPLINFSTQQLFQHQQLKGGTASNPTNTSTTTTTNTAANGTIPSVPPVSSGIRDSQASVPVVTRSNPPPTTGRNLVSLPDSTGFLFNVLISAPHTRMLVYANACLMFALSFSFGITCAHTHTHTCTYTHNCIVRTQAITLKHSHKYTLHTSLIHTRTNHTN